MSADIIHLFRRERRPLTPEERAHIIQRMADLSVEIVLLQSEWDQLNKRLGDGPEAS